MRKPRRVVKPHQFPAPDPDLDAKWEIKMNTKSPDYDVHGTDFKGKHSQRKEETTTKIN